MATVENGADQGTSAFRRLLAEASSGEQARVDALMAFSQRIVFAATWPGQNQAVRTLTNREGETAMPLFTGRELLEETATRFGWRNPDGTLPMRQLGAREALQHALARGVHFVVVDIGCEHSVEFSREEVEPLLALQAQKGGSGPFAGKGEPEAAIRDAVRRSSRPPPVGSQVAAMAARSAPMRGPSVEIDAPFAGVKTRAVSQPIVIRPAMVGAATQFDGSQRPPAAQSMPAVQPRPLSQPMAAAVPAVVAPPQPRAAAPAPAPYVLPPSDRPPSMLNAAAAPDNARPDAAVNKAAALEMAAALTSAAKAAGDPEAQRAAEEMSKLLMRNAVEAEEVVDKRLDAASNAGRKIAALFMGTALPEDEPSAAEPERDPMAPAVLPDPLLQGISTGLRSFPEVEWACVLSDGSDLPVIGVRVDPSFLNRVTQISDGILGIGDKHEQPLQVLLLNTPDLVRNARKQGKAFFPWKR